MSGMKRRDFITLLGGAAAAWPLAARAQQTGRVPKVGLLSSGTQAGQGQWVAAFLQRMRELGWIEGRTVVLEVRWAEGRPERFTEIAAEFVRLTHGHRYWIASPLMARPSRPCFKGWVRGGLDLRIGSATLVSS